MTTVASVVLVVATGAIGVMLVGNSYAFDERHVEIPVADGSLSGVLTTPKCGETHGVVVMVHGDGPVDATQNGLYDPLFEGAAASGYATLSWSKLGVGGSDGDWLAQTLPDRAAEVSAAIDWAKAQPDVTTSKIVLWGASQAGWVLPAVVADRDDIAGVVAVGTAINWLRQGQWAASGGDLFSATSAPTPPVISPERPHVTCRGYSSPASMTETSTSTKLPRSTVGTSAETSRSHGLTRCTPWRAP